MSVVGVAVFGLSGCSGDDNAGIAVGTVGRSTVTEVVEAPAKVAARAQARIAAPADGRVAELRVREGQTVRAGRVLARIDSPRAKKALRDAREADAEAASAGSVALPASWLGVQQQQADAAAEEAFARARRAAERIPDPRLRAQTLAVLRASEAQYLSARAQARDAVRRFDAGLGSLAKALGSLASAQRVQTRAAVDLAARTVAALTVRAPIDGTVSLAGDEGTGGGEDLLGRLPEGVQGQAGRLLGGGGGGGGGGSVSGPLVEGQPVRSGETLITVTDSSSLSLTAEVDETDVLLVEPGVPATAELDAVPDATYAATVRTIDPMPTTSTRGGVSYVVRLALGRGTGPDGTFAPVPRPGMSAIVDLKVRTARDAVAVPAPAVFRDGSRDAVWVVTGGKAARRPVRLGAQGEQTIQVLEGLEVGDRIVVRGADRVHEGQQLS